MSFATSFSPESESLGEKNHEGLKLGWKMRLELYCGHKHRLSGDNVYYRSSFFGSARSPE